MSFLVPIVEGHGEEQAVPLLLFRIAEENGNPGQIRVNPPIRVKSGSFLHDMAYFNKYITLAAAKAAQRHGHVLILLDCEDNCPATLGPDILCRAQGVRPDVAYHVFLAYREFETWFITASRSLRGFCGLSENLEPPSDPERIRNAKGWLSDHMPKPYDPIIHQLEFTRRFDLNEAAANGSFKRLVLIISKLLQTKDFLL